MRATRLVLLPCFLCISAWMGLQATALGADRPDLTIKSVSSPPPTLAAATSFNVEATVRNRGKKRAKASSTGFVLSLDTRLSDDDAPLGDEKTRGVNPRKSAPAQTLLTIPPGTPVAVYRVLACADQTRKLRERKEGNNCRAAGGLLTVAAAAASSSPPPTATPPPPPTPLQPGPGALLINEALTDPTGVGGDANGDGTGDPGQDEFVEIFNMVATTVDLSSVTISDEMMIRHMFPAGTYLPAGCAAVVFGGGTPTGGFGGALVQTASGGGLSLNNGGLPVSINLGATLIATETYPASTDNVSFTHDPDGTTGTLVLHNAATGNTGNYSPGTKVDGTSFSGC